MHSSQSAHAANEESCAPAQLRECSLLSEPAFLIRRAHQVAYSVFTQTCANLELTISQYSVLLVLRHQEPISQNALGRAVVLDRATTSVVVANLVSRGWVVACADPNDRRRTLLKLTEEGRILIARAERLAVVASQKMLAVFSEAQANMFMNLLDHFNRSHGANSAS